jgi:putative peptidoglycan binding protein
MKRADRAGSLPSADSVARSAKLYMKGSRVFRVLTVAALAALLPVTAAAAFAQHMGGFGGGGSHHSMGGSVRGGPHVAMGNRLSHDGRFFNNHRFAGNDRFFDHRRFANHDRFFDHRHRFFDNDRDDRFFHHHHDRFFFVFDFAAFGFPWWYPDYYYYYPYYGYDPYYGYGGAYDPQYWSDLAVSVQSGLAQRGYYHGAIDGEIGSGSRQAIRAFQAAQGLPVTGMIDPKLLKALGIKYRTA